MAYKALVIDDDRATLDLMEFQLNAEGFQVTKAENGQQGLKLIEENDFDIILTDLQLPGISGIEIVERSKQLSPDTEMQAQQQDYCWLLNQVKKHVNN